MLNNPWPSLIWHLFDYWLAPGGGYFGARKACEPVHIQYSYDDRSIVVVNSTYSDVGALTARAAVLDLAGKRLWQDQSANLVAAADSSRRVLSVPPPQSIPGITSTYFVVLTLDGPGGRLGTNWYWLSTTDETYDIGARSDYVVPTTNWADYSALATLAPATLAASARLGGDGNDEVVSVTLSNPAGPPAFFVRVQVDARGAGGEREILPVRWSDNYVSMAAGETLQLTARYRRSDRGDALPIVRADGVNLAPMQVILN
jgi:exo-1,4-beta-D-glucosaminidase